MHTYEELSPEKYMTSKSVSDLQQTDDDLQTSSSEKRPWDTQKTVNLLSAVAAIGMAVAVTFWLANGDDSGPYRPQTVEGHLASTPGFGILLWLKGEGIDAAEKLDRKLVKQRRAQSQQLKRQLQEIQDYSQQQATKFSQGR